MTTRSTDTAAITASERDRTMKTRLPLALLLTAALGLSLLVPTGASSHREAPLITEDPVADNTDVYAFVSPDRPDSVTLIANWIPFEEPAGGPNFYNFGEDVLYEINVDSDGDAKDDVSFEFEFQSNVRDPNTPLYNTGPITVEDGEYSDTFNYYQTYDMWIDRNGERYKVGDDLPVPPNNVGPRSTPDYPQLADAAISEVDHGIEVFAGQRDEAFYVDLGSIFDLGGLRPFNPAHVVPLDEAPGKDATAGFNVHSIALKVPTHLLTESNKQPTIGVYSTTSRRSVRVFADGATPKSRGRWVQVSRLGNPLVNEVVVPLGLKDAFNALDPVDDVSTFVGAKAPPLSTRGDIPLVQDPILAELIEQLYPGVKTPSGLRNDLVAVYLTGIVLPDGTNLNNNVGDDGQPSEMLRLNTSIPPSSSDINGQDRLGLLAGEADGFPNGRRLGDDVVDISLRAVAGATPFTPAFDRAPNNELGDGVDRNDRQFLRSFPYIPHPFSGYADPNGNVAQGG
jgi:Domain of unknown function (DUF4331)